MRSDLRLTSLKFNTIYKLSEASIIRNSVFAAFAHPQTFFLVLNERKLGTIFFHYSVK